MSRNARTPAPRRRRIALSFGMAAGAALTAASFSLGTAPVAGADVVDADPVSDLFGAADPAAVSAAGVPETDALSYLVEALDPEAFNSSGAPTGVLGLLAYGLDTYLLGPSGIDNLIYPYVEEIIKSLPSGAASVDVDPVSDLVLALDPSAFSAGVADLTAPTAAGLLDPVIDGLLNSGLSLF